MFYAYINTYLNVKVFRIFSLISGDTHVGGATLWLVGAFVIRKIAASAWEYFILNFWKIYITAYFNLRGLLKE